MLPLPGSLGPRQVLAGDDGSSSSSASGSAAARPTQAGTKAQLRAAEGRLLALIRTRAPGSKDVSALRAEVASLRRTLESESMGPSVRPEALLSTLTSLRAENSLL